jgi:hypothetical protein
MCEQQSAAFLRVAALVPQVTLDVVKNEKVAEDTTVIELRIANKGYLGTYGLSSARKLPLSEPLRATIEADGLEVTAPSETVIDVGHLDGWGRGLYNGVNIFFPWTRGNVHEKFVTLVVRGRGRLKLKVGSVRVGYRTLTLDVK